MSIFRSSARNTTLTAIAGVILVLAIGLYVAKIYSEKNKSIKLKQSLITENNQETEVVVDKLFRITLPCKPSGNQPMILDLGELKSTKYFCMVQNSTGGTTSTYFAENEIFNSVDYRPEDFYNGCEDTTDESDGITLHVIDNHEEKVHGINFRFCSLVGNDGYTSMTARTLRGNAVQSFGFSGDESSSKGIYPKFRGDIESFNYL